MICKLSDMSSPRGRLACLLYRAYVYNKRSTLDGDTVVQLLEQGEYVIILSPPHGGYFTAGHATEKLTMTEILTTAGRRGFIENHILGELP